MWADVRSRGTGVELDVDDSHRTSGRPVTMHTASGGADDPVIAMPLTPIQLVSNFPLCGK